MPVRICETQPIGSPAHQHDCAECVFMFSDVDDEGKPLDLYVCPKQLVGGLTVVCRFSSDGPDYYSGGPDYLDAVVGTLKGERVPRRYTLMLLAYALWAHRRIPKEA